METRSTYKHDRALAKELKRIVDMPSLRHINSSYLGMVTLPLEHSFTGTLGMHMHLMNHLLILDHILYLVIDLKSSQCPN